MGANETAVAIAATRPKVICAPDWGEKGPRLGGCGTPSQGARPRPADVFQRGKRYAKARLMAKGRGRNLLHSYRTKPESERGSPVHQRRPVLPRKKLTSGPASPRSGR